MALNPNLLDLGYIASFAIFYFRATALVTRATQQSWFHSQLFHVTSANLSNSLFHGRDKIQAVPPASRAGCQPMRSHFSTLLNQRSVFHCKVLTYLLGSYFSIKLPLPYQVFLVIQQCSQAVDVHL